MASGSYTPARSITPVKAHVIPTRWLLRRAACISPELGARGVLEEFLSEHDGHHPFGDDAQAKPAR
jgi:hypothetical protein